MHVHSIYRRLGIPILVGIACGLIPTSSNAILDNIRKWVEDRTGVRVPVPTPEDVGKAVGKTVSEGGKVLDAAGKEIGIFVSNVSNEGNKGLENIGRETNKGIGNLVQTVQKAGKDTEKTVAKAGQDVEKNIAKSGRDVEEAAHAVGKYIERSAQGVGKSADRALDRMRQGKFIDAIWHAALDPLQNAEENAAIAAQESSLIRTVGQVASTAYGGPGGAAAYSAWLAYKETGDMNVALRVGILTGATSAAFQQAGKIPTAEEYGLLRKTVVTAAIGGAAIAAAGGNAEQVKNGFISAGAMVLVQDHYAKVTKKDLDQESMKPSKAVPAYCVGDTAKNCTAVPKDAILKKDGDRVIEVDRAKLDRRVPSVGIEGSKNPVAGDNSAPMKLVSKIPGAQGMSVMHDNWVASSLPDLLNQPTIVPAIVVYYTGTGALYFDALRKTAVEMAINKQVEADLTKKPGEPSAKLPSVEIPQKGRALEAVQVGSDYTATYLCAKDKREHSWRLTLNKGDAPFACRLDSFGASTGALESVTHLSNHAYCKKKVRQEVEKALNAGLSCATLRSGAVAKGS